MITYDISIYEDNSTNLKSDYVEVPIKKVVQPTLADFARSKKYPACVQKELKELEGKEILERGDPIIPPWSFERNGKFFIVYGHEQYYAVLASGEKNIILHCSIKK